MRMRVILILGSVAALVAAGCAPSGADGTQPQPRELRAVAAFYPLAEAVRRVGGPAVAVRDLTPPGVEPHDLELTPDDLAAIGEADLVVFLGGGFQPAVEEAVAQSGGAVLDALEGVDVLEGGGVPHADEDAHADEEHDQAMDPHVWLDPLRYASIVERIAEVLAGIAPDRAGAFRANAEAFVAQLRDLDAAYRDGLASCESRLLVVSHAAFGYLADAYGLDQAGVAGLSPEAEPDPRRLAELEELVRSEGVRTIFTEPLAPAALTEVIASEVGVEVAVLDPIEALTPEQVSSGADYVSVMRANLEVLRDGLRCV
ncbi:MAG: zinc ABC transporter substrate-binding protein [Actinomycetota bacterium]|jgi:zinc transport system substrate-binding protein|nr:MAG: zinc ABC transporter substrate-binding protein [Actinomycetota bacterium]